MATQTYTKYAFISYSHRDMAFAKWLHRRLEGFRLPSEVHNDIEAKNRYLRPVFRDQDDLDTGILGDELRHKLEESKFLILICSVNSAQSEWVSNEAKAFVEMGRLDHIIPVIIPHGNTPERELFPKFLREYFEENPDKELLGVNIGEVGKEKALVRVVSRMLGVSFDSLWKRHQRRKRQRITVAAISTVVAVVAAYLFAVPVSVTPIISMQKADLPVGESVMFITDGAEYASDPRDPHFDPIHVPGYRRFTNLPLYVCSRFFVPVDTVVPIGFGLSRQIDIKLKRSDTFAVYAGNVYDPDMDPLPDVTVTVAGHTSITDQEGHFSITLPLAEQRTELPISLECQGYKSIVREDETPGQELKFILHR